MTRIKRSNDVINEYAITSLGIHVRVTWAVDFKPSVGITHAIGVRIVLRAIAQKYRKP